MGGSTVEHLLRRLERNMPGGGPSKVIALVVLVLAGVAAWTAFYTVPSDSVAVVQRFGKYLMDVPPGCMPSCRLASMGRPSFRSSGS